ncbi:helix-turn-helix domain-containing protein [Staphylococcus hyicus]|uniref:helix-turn-helix domain-containing protein n=1 Tax=Staphylococcus hyicus TaxID=1284 RepID=UPI00057E7148|nr:AraC family transcriptional regulator [Staphylococcus hyicus]AJC95017.1 AraC family transcriptional regulator [Staphylococcus hyicus]RTX67313.1 AraC family transcriptional regulator [Staphylococcus hyicus]SQE46508.1 AraC family transcriptional regulator [Staphylococcus hyicus]
MIDVKTLEIVKAHALDLLKLDMNVFELTDYKQMSHIFKSPFTNVKRKQFKIDFQHFISQLESRKIYHYKNLFGVQYVLFKYKKCNQIVIIGPFLEKRPNERMCHEMLLNANISISNLTTLKQYLIKVPVCHYNDALKMAHLAVRFLKNKFSHYPVMHIDFNLHPESVSYAEQKLQHHYMMTDIKDRYELENKMLAAIQNGNIDEALALHTQINLFVSGLKRLKDDLLNLKYRAYLQNTLCRKTIEKARVNLLTIDVLSAKYAALIDEAENIEILEIVTHDMIREYAETALKVNALKHTPKINKVIQYIEMYLDQTLTLSELAKSVKLSPTYLSRTFSQEIGKTIPQYIMELRLKKACDLLETTEMPIEHVAQYVGFKRQSYFSHCFKKVYGCTPIQYKQTYNEKSKRFLRWF